jgi:hypothetical protein
MSMDLNEARKICEIQKRSCSLSDPLRSALETLLNSVDVIEKMLTATAAIELTDGTILTKQQPPQPFDLSDFVETYKQLKLGRKVVAH